VYWDWVGVRIEERYSDEASSGEFKRVSGREWKRYVTIADSLRRVGRRLPLSTKTPEAGRERVVQECIGAAQ